MKAADEITRAFLISAMLLVAIGILMSFDRSMQSSGAVVTACGLAGTLGFGIVRSSIRRELLQERRSTDPAQLRTIQRERP
jgi:predicted benzoate:H+ symporter BenE